MTPLPQARPTDADVFADPVSTQKRRAKGWPEQAAIALVSAGVIILQIALSRLLSVLVWYHSAFVAVALVMLGLGLPGIWLSRTAPSRTTLLRALLAASALVPCGVAALLWLSRALPQWGLALAVVCLLPGFIALGTSVCVLLARAESNAVPRLYAADLGGAMLGAVGAIPLLWTLPTPTLAFATAVFPASAALILGGRRERAVAGALAVLIALVCVWQRPLEVRHTKSYDEEKLQRSLLAEKWTPTGRLTVFDGHPLTQAENAFIWGAGTANTMKDITQYWLEQDGNAGTPILDGRGGLEPLRFVSEDVTSVVYGLRRFEKAAIVGVGGGRDMIAAILGGVEHVTGIEMSEGIVALMRGPYREFSGALYDDPRVEIRAEEGRSHLARTTETYDVIQLSLVDTWAATAAGAFALSENNLYTVEAFGTYFDRLTAGGVLSVSRWEGRETSRLVALAIAALKRRGVSDFTKHMAAVRGGRAVSLLVSPAPLRESDVAAIERLSELRGFQIIAMPGKRFNLPAALPGQDLSPPVDDRPFFFQFESAFFPTPANHAFWPLQVTAVSLAVFSVLAFGLPFLRRKIGVGSRELARATVYMFAIGGGFMFIEMALLQRFVLFLGHPSYATAVVLAGLLGGLGLGSLCAHRLPRALAFFAILSITLLNLSLPAIFSAAMAQAFAMRVVLALAVALSVGIFMGPWLPWVMSRFGAEQRAWLWAANGTASVLATLFSVPLAMTAGFSGVTLLGVAFYLVAWGAGLRHWRA